jgi:hypothetical protein
MIPPMEFRVRKGSLRIYECGYNLHLKRAQTSNFSRKKREKRKVTTTDNKTPIINCHVSHYQKKKHDDISKNTIKKTSLVIE